MAVMNRAAKWTKSVAAWKMIVLASSIDRAAHDGRRRGLCNEVRVVGGPRTKHRGMGEDSQRPVKSPNAMMEYGVHNKKTSVLGSKNLEVRFRC